MPAESKSPSGFTVDDEVHIQWVRHGKSVAQEQKKARRDESMRDAPISECGKKQVEALAREIGTSQSADEPTLIIASPLMRALQTAAILRKGFSVTSGPIQTHYGLAEHGSHMPENQGTSVATLRKEPIFADAVDFSSLDDASWPGSGGCLAHLQEFSGWLCYQSHNNVLVVSHKLVIECFLRELRIETSPWVENCVPIHTVVKRSELQAFAARSENFHRPASISTAAKDRIDLPKLGCLMPGGITGDHTRLSVPPGEPGMSENETERLQLREFIIHAVDQDDASQASSGVQALTVMLNMIDGATPTRANPQVMPTFEGMTKSEAAKGWHGVCHNNALAELCAVAEKNIAYLPTICVTLQSHVEENEIIARIHSGTKITQIHSLDDSSSSDLGGCAGHLLAENGNLFIALMPANADSSTKFLRPKRNMALKWSDLQPTMPCEVLHDRVWYQAVVVEKLEDDGCDRVAVHYSGHGEEENYEEIEKKSWMSRLRAPSPSVHLYGLNSIKMARKADGIRTEKHRKLKSYGFVGDIFNVIEAIIVAQSHAVSDVSGVGSDAVSDASGDKAEKRSPPGIVQSIAKPHEREYAFAPKGMVRAAPYPDVCTDAYQHEAISSITYNVEAIQGPPGTGKSSMISAILSDYLVDKCTLVTCVQNKAVCALVEKLAATDILFMVIGGRCAETQAQLATRVLPLTLHYTAWGQAQDAALKAQKRWRCQMRQQGWLSSDAEDASPWAVLTDSLWFRDEVERMVCVVEQRSMVLLCTVDSTHKVRRRLHVVIVDEAGSVPEWKMPLLTRFNPSLLLMVGDHKQLPSYTECKDDNQCPIEIASTLQRLANALEHTHPIKMLLIQYRMHPDIAKFVSRHFYRNLLRTDAHTHDARQRSLAARAESGEIGGGNAIVWYSHSELESTEANSSSKVNHEEVRIISEEIVPSLAAGGTKQKVTVITFYKAQQRLLQEKLGEAATVMTVDSAQGSEADVVILSCVRSNTEKGIGHVEDKRRINVALSRAKDKLIVVGNAACLCWQRGKRRRERYVVWRDLWKCAFKLNIAAHKEEEAAKNFQTMNEYRDLKTDATVAAADAADGKEARKAEVLNMEGLKLKEVVENDDLMFGLQENKAKMEKEKEKGKEKASKTIVIAPEFINPFAQRPEEPPRWDNCGGGRSGGGSRPATGGGAGHGRGGVPTTVGRPYLHPGLSAGVDDQNEFPPL